MSRITQELNDKYSWSCAVDIDFHRKQGRKGLLGVVIVCVFVFTLFLILSLRFGAMNDMWVPLLVIGVILAVALPLLFLWNGAGDPQEQYVMTDKWVRSGYGKGSVFSDYAKTKEVVLTEKYIELVGKHKTNRIYVPAEDMAFVRDYILVRLPEDVVIRDHNQQNERMQAS